MRISAWIVFQQQYALPRSANPSSNNIESATIQLLSLVFGSAAVVPVADLGLDGVDALVMVTVVLVAVGFLSMPRGLLGRVACVRAICDARWWCLWC